jgi:hypothetical protein
MKTVISSAIMALCIPGFALAAADKARSCIVKATEALPKINGLQVKKSGTRSMPPEQLANWKGQSKPMIVDIDAVATGIAERYSYICASNPSGTAFVQRIPN